MGRPAVFLCAGARTAIGAFQGGLGDVVATDLGAEALKAVLARSGVPAEKIDEVILGCVLMAGTGQAPARQALIKAGIPHHVQAMAINKVCSSGLAAVMLAAQKVELGHAEAILAGGMESMSQAPYLLPGARKGQRLGHGQILDSILVDGLWDPYKDFHMGNAAELCARTYGFTREDQDAFALRSYERARAAIAAGDFAEEIFPVSVRQGKSTVEFLADEEPGKAQLEKIPQLKPAFDKEGTVTAANASSINDGSAAVLVCGEAFVKAHNLTPLARIESLGWFGQEPEWFTTSPVGAVNMALKKAGKSVADVDLFEINEAFSAVALACGKDLAIDPDKLNVSGGAVALGHPIGASGARILVTLLYGLKRLSKKTGVVGICNGGGEATAMLVERT